MEIHASFILEAVGRPQEFVIETLEDMTKKIGEIPKTAVIKKKVAEAKKIEHESVKTEIFSSFAEVEVTTTLEGMEQIVFAFMPSHIEIIKPNNIEMRNCDLNSFFQGLARKLHQYDEVTKTLYLQRNILVNRIKAAEDKLKEMGVEFKLEDDGIKFENLEQPQEKKKSAKKSKKK